MANSNDRDEYREISCVRPVLKRKMAFALKSKAQYASAIGGTRSRHGVNDDDEGSKLEIGESGMTKLKKIPRKLKDLLETGLLEGISVRYQYGAKTKGKTGDGLKGRVSGTGIICSCPKCKGNKVYSPNEFEIHAHSRNKRPADYLYLENGKNLRGVLNACANAPLEALESIIQRMIGCTTSSTEQNLFSLNCKSSFTGGGGKEVSLSGSCKEISSRCTLCRGHDFSTSFGPRTIIICDQCEREFHVSCLKEHDMDNLKGLPVGKWFCCKDCSRTHSALEDQVAIGDDVLPDSLLNIVNPNSCISWRLLSGRSARKASEESDLLSKVLSIFHEQFDPMADLSSGVDDLIPHMVFGRDVGDQDFRGMYCAVLKVNSNIVSTGIIRVFGKEMAELPLIATSRESQKQGYFRVLFFCLEKLLLSLNVKKLVLPAAEGAECPWTKKFGFSEIPKDELTNYQEEYYPLMVFDNTTMLQKSIGRS